MSLKQFGIIAIITFIGWIFWIKCSIADNEKQWKIDTPQFQNNIVIKGIVDSLSDAGNHCFGIIYMKNFKANVTDFNPRRNRFFPYAIKGKQCEIYSAICLQGLQKGDSIIINSNKRNAKVIAKDKNYSGDYSLDFVDSEVDYIKRNSKIITIK